VATTAMIRSSAHPMPNMRKPSPPYKPVRDF
jgi:hypothetical protein